MLMFENLCPKKFSVQVTKDGNIVGGSGAMGYD